MAPSLQDVYVDATVPVTHRLRARAAATVLVPGAVVTGASAAVLWGVDLVDVRDDVELTVPAGSNPRRHPGLIVRRTSLDESDVCRRAGVRVTTSLATALRLAGLPPRDEAVVAIDRMLAATGLDLGELRARAGLPGAASARVRAVCALADGLAESPQETRLRLLMHRGRLPAPVAQHVVRHDGGFVARVDFAWPELKVAVEYDGAWHGQKGQLARDRRRLNRLQEAGWRVVFVTAADLHDPARLLATIRSALAR
ncbi:endonuclease domain-containing protein [Blastococcus sp. SYSU DS0973]